ncbi:MAG: DUF2442 domain-containing protein [Parvularculaceae bacterium]
MLTKIAKIDRLGGHRLKFHFTDGSGGAFDFASVVMSGGPMAEPLRDPVYFARVFLEFGAPTWPNGYDMAPEWVRRELEAAGELKKRVAAQ